MSEDEDSSSPYWLDDLGRKHECRSYDDSDSTIVKIDHDGRSIDLIVYKYAHSFKMIFPDMPPRLTTENAPA